MVFPLILNNYSSAVMLRPNEGLNIKKRVAMVETLISTNADSVELVSWLRTYDWENNKPLAKFHCTAQHSTAQFSLLQAPLQ